MALGAGPNGAVRVGRFVSRRWGVVVALSAAQAEEAAHGKNILLCHFGPAVFCLPGSYERTASRGSADARAARSL